MSSCGNNNNDNASPTTPKPSDKQMNLLAIIMQNIQSKPDINVSFYPTAFSLRRMCTDTHVFIEVRKIDQ